MLSRFFPVGRDKGANVFPRAMFQLAVSGTKAGLGAKHMDRLPKGYYRQYDVAGNTSDVRAFNEARFCAATGRDPPAEHGLIRLPPATPNGDEIYI